MKKILNELWKKPFLFWPCFLLLLILWIAIGIQYYHLLSGHQNEHSFLGDITGLLEIVSISSVWYWVRSILFFLLLPMFMFSLCMRHFSYFRGGIKLIIKPLQVVKNTYNGSAVAALIDDNQIFIDRKRSNSRTPRYKPQELNFAFAGTELPLGILWDWFRNLIFGAPYTLKGIIDDSVDEQIKIILWKSKDSPQWKHGTDKIYVQDSSLQKVMARLQEELYLAIEGPESLASYYWSQHRFSYALYHLERRNTHRARFYRGQILADNHKLEEGIKELTELLEDLKKKDSTPFIRNVLSSSDPGEKTNDLIERSQLSLDIAEYYLRLGRQDQTISILQRSSEPKKKAACALLWARSLLTEEDTEGAIEKYTESIAENVKLLEKDHGIRLQHPLWLEKQSKKSVNSATKVRIGRIFWDLADAYCERSFCNSEKIDNAIQDLHSSINVISQFKELDYEDWGNCTMSEAKYHLEIGMLKEKNDDVNDAIDFYGKAFELYKSASDYYGDRYEEDPNDYEFLTQNSWAHCGAYESLSKGLDKRDRLSEEYEQALLFIVKLLGILPDDVLRDYLRWIEEGIYRFGSNYTYILNKQAAVRLLENFVFTTNDILQAELVELAQFLYSALGLEDNDDPESTEVLGLEDLTNTSLYTDILQNALKVLAENSQAESLSVLITYTIKASQEYSYALRLFSQLGESPEPRHLTESLYGIACLSAIKGEYIVAAQKIFEASQISSSMEYYQRAQIDSEFRNIELFFQPSFDTIDHSFYEVWG